MRNNKLYRSNRQFMWGNILIAIFVVILAIVIIYLCGYSL